MTTPGYDKTILAKIIADPPGTWRRPRQVDATQTGTGVPSTLIPSLQRVVRGPHRPVVYAVAVTPVNVGAGDIIKAESWYLPLVGGQVQWTIDSYPCGTASLEVSADMNLWRPGPLPTDPDGLQHYVSPQPDTPTGSSETVPWAVLPYGTIVSVYRGWEYQGRVSGFRVFDGIVTESNYDRPGRRWVLSAADFTKMCERVSWRAFLTLRELIVNAGGPAFNTSSGLQDEYYFRVALSAMLRESGEFWWPLPNSQLDAAAAGSNSMGETSIFDVQSIAGVTQEGVKVDYEVGGRDAWGLIEEWSDAAGVECYTQPGEYARIWVGPPLGVNTGATDTRITLLDVGDTGVVTGFEAAFQPVVNRLYFTRWADYGPRTWQIAADATQEGAAPNIDRYVTISVDGMNATVEVDGPGIAAQTTMAWGDGQQPNETPWYDETGTTNTESSEGTQAYARKFRWVHQYKQPGSYTIRVRPGSGANIFERTVEIHYDNKKHLVGFWNRFNVVSPMGVRRTGRVSVIQEREMSRRKIGSIYAPSEDDMDQYAADMALRTRGYARRNTFQTVPMPWLAPRQTIRVDMRDGLKAERHQIRSTTLPLDPAGTMTVETVNERLGSPAAGSPRVDLVKGTQTDTTPGAQVTATATVKNGSFLQVAWGDGSGKTTIDNTAGTTPWTVPLTHTYTTDGTFKVTVWTDDGMFDRIQFEVPTP